MNPYLKPGAVLLCAAAGIWCAKRPLHTQYLQSKAVILNQFAQTLAHTSLVDSPTAHFLLADFAGLHRYQASNRNLPPPLSDRVVFYGDSITDFWPTSFAAEFFPGRQYIGRGISGQSTPELIWRFQQDVLNLHPSVVVLLAGTNDVILSQRSLTTQQTTTNIETMVSMAQRHGIHVVLCSILPVAQFAPPKQAAFTGNIQEINTALRAFAAQQGIPYVDYFAAMSDETGSLRPSFSPDGIHPNAAGYAVMQPLAQAAIDRTSGSDSPPKA